MNLTRATWYAIRAVGYLAKQKEGPLIPSRQIADVLELPPKFLTKILLLLVRSGLLATRRGARGGFRLARPADEVTLLLIAEAIQGPVRCEVPDLDNGGTSSIHAKLQTVCEQAADIFRKQLQAATIADLMRKR